MTTKFERIVLVPLVLSALAPTTIVSLGCRTADPCRGGKNCEDIAAGSIPQPIGTYACQWQTAQKERADRDDLVLYRREWRGDTAELDGASQERLVSLAPRFGDPQAAVYVEPTGDDGLNEARRRQVVETLLASGVPDAETRVRFGRGEALGMYGIEAPRIVPGYLGAGRNGGGQSGMGMGGGGMGGGGMGGGGGGMGGAGMGGGGVF